MDGSSVASFAGRQIVSQPLNVAGPGVRFVTVSDDDAVTVPPAALMAEPTGIPKLSRLRETDFATNPAPSEGPRKPGRRLTRDLTACDRRVTGSA